MASMVKHRDEAPDEDLEAEGIPTTEEMPPGIDIETSSEAMMVPRDHSIAAGSDPAYAITAAEQSRRESVSDRAAREEPEAGDETGAPLTRGGVSMYEPASDVSDTDMTAEAIAVRGEEEGRASAPEEAAMRVVDEEGRSV
jgi:hypothetical protein